MQDDNINNSFIKDYKKLDQQNIDEKIENQKPDDFNFFIDESALIQLNNIINKYYPVAYKLKISVLGGGCAGFSYTYQLIKENTDYDIEIKQKNITILIDTQSATLLNNCILVFIKTLGNQHFEIQRPKNSNSSRCGCGNSFNI